MRELMNKLGYSFKDEELLRRALTRRSAIEERVRLRGGLTRRSAIEERVKGAADNDYQSLEFVGDAALKPVVTFLLFKNDPRITQSSLDEKVRPLIANDGVMLRIARELNIDSYLIKGEGEREVTDKMRVDAVEAILGAVYLDSMLHTKGKKSFIVVIQKLWSPFMELGAAAADRHGEGHVTVAAPAPVIVPKSVTTGRAKEPHTAVAAPKPRLAVPAPVPVAAPPLLSPRGSRLFCSLNMAEISVEKFEKIIGVFKRPAQKGFKYSFRYKLEEAKTLVLCFYLDEIPPKFFNAYYDWTRQEKKLKKKVGKWLKREFNKK